MSLFKRGKVWWTYLYQDGIRHQQSTGTSDRRKAVKIEDRFKEDLNNRRFQLIEVDPNVKFKEISARFIASGSVRRHHVYHLQFVLPFFGEIAVSRISKSLADEYRKARHIGKTIKEATVNRDLSVLRRILFWALDERLIAVNPLSRLRMARERRTRRRILSIHEEDLLLGVAKTHLKEMIMTALDTGMRRGELTGQRWEDVDLIRRTLYVTSSKTPEGESREIPLTQRTYELLQKRRRETGLVFQYKEQPLRIIKRSWKTALKDSGIRPLRFHDLRHCFATRLMEAGVLQEVRMSLMGHSTGARIHEVYTHIELPVKREAIRKLEEWKIQEQRREQERMNHDGHAEADRET